MLKSLFAGIIALFAIFVVGGVGYYVVTNQSPVSLIPATMNSENRTASTSTPQVVNNCADFNTFSQYVLQEIRKPDTEGPVPPSKYVIPSFEWKRSANEPFITYPIIQGVVASYGYSADGLTNTDVISAIQNDTNAIDQNIAAEAAALGFTPDALNTLPFQSFNVDETLQTFGFRKGADLYSLVLERNGGQEPSEGSVTVACGSTDPRYDAFYNALRLQADPTVRDPYHNDYVQVDEVSPDGTVYDLTGSSNLVKIGNYYYFDGNTVRLVSDDSEKAECITLEARKVGAGMQCAGGTGMVTYSGSGPVAGSVLSTSPATATVPAYFSFSVSTGADLTGNKNEACYIDFGDGKQQVLFVGDTCVSNFESLLHSYTAPGSYTATVYGTWKDPSTGESMTEQLASTTVSVLP
jgi:hypothetical protein